MAPFLSLSKNASLAALAIGASLVASGALVAACSTDNSNQAPPVYGDDGGDATAVTPSPDAAGDTGQAQDGSGPSDGGGADAPDASASGADAGDAGDGSTTPGCTPALSDAACWSCPAASDGSVEFLNQCAGTGVHCVSFDNLAKLPGFDAGLPHL